MQGADGRRRWTSRPRRCRKARRWSNRASLRALAYMHDQPMGALPDVPLTSEKPGQRLDAGRLHHRQRSGRPAGEHRLLLTKRRRWRSFQTEEWAAFKESRGSEVVMYGQRGTGRAPGADLPGPGARPWRRSASPNRPSRQADPTGREGGPPPVPELVRPAAVRLPADGFPLRSAGCGRTDAMTFDEHRPRPAGRPPGRRGAVDRRRLGTDGRDGLRPRLSSPGSSAPG